jgi:hypothetical protein
MNTKGDGEVNFSCDTCGNLRVYAEHDSIPYTREELAKLFDEAALDCDFVFAQPSRQKWLDRAAKLRGGK